MKAEEEATGGVTSGDEGGKGADHSDDIMSDGELMMGMGEEDEDICVSEDEDELLSVTEDC